VALQARRVLVGWMATLALACLVLQGMLVAVACLELVELEADQALMAKQASVASMANPADTAKMAGMVSLGHLVLAAHLERLVLWVMLVTL